MEFEEAYEKLTDRALVFYSVLARFEVFKQPLSKDEFLKQVVSHIKSTAENLAKEWGDPWVTVLGFPGTLLFGLSDCLFHSSYDGMEGAQDCYDALSNLLNQAGIDFVWTFDSDEETLRFRAGATSWEVECKALRWIDEPISWAKIDPHLTKYLLERNWMLYPVTTGDSWITYLLVRPRAVNALKYYLIPAYGPAHPEYDPRVEWIYVGIPEDQRPSSIWEL